MLDRPSDQAAGKSFLGDSPFPCVTELFEPGADAVRSLLVMDLHDDEWALLCEQTGSAAQDFVLGTFHIDLDQLGHWSTAGHKIVEGRHRYGDDLAISENGALSIRFHSTLRRLIFSAAKWNYRFTPMRPHGCVDRLNA